VLVSPVLVPVLVLVPMLASPVLVLLPVPRLVLEPQVLVSLPACNQW
jgi:hypothetical protein